MMCHVLLIINLLIGNRLRKEFLDYLAPVCLVFRDDFLSSRMIKTGYRQVVRVERLVANPRIVAILK